MSDVFDLLAGTSTGSILASSLGFPNEKGGNKFYAPDVIDIYINNGTEVFSEYKMKKSSVAFGTFMFALIGAVIGYFVGLWVYTDPEQEKIFKEFVEYVKNTKKVKKGKGDE